MAIVDVERIVVAIGFIVIRPRRRPHLLRPFHRRLDAMIEIDLVVIRRAQGQDLIRQKVN